MKNVIALPTLFKRDTKGKVRVLTIEYGWNDENDAATRSIAGIQDGKLVTSGWNTCQPKNVGKVNATTSRSQSIAEAQASWDKKSEKEYFTEVSKIDSYDKFKPMLAADYTKRPQESGWSQPKLDGIRCIANSSGLWTRAGKEITSCPHIWESVKPFLEANPNIVLDGELYNHQLKEDFNKITSLVRKLKSTPEDIAESASLVQYHVYDCFVQDNDMLFINRIKLAYGAKSDVVKIVQTDFANNQAELDSLYSYYMEEGYEGQMVRNNALYQNKRSNDLLKRKEFITEEFRVVTMLEGQGNWAGHVKHFGLLLPSGETCGAGVRGKQEVLKELWEVGDTPTWATLRYFGLTPDGVPRFPVVIDYGFGERTD
jgi:DNA ligase-1